MTPTTVNIGAGMMGNTNYASPTIIFVFNLKLNGFFQSMFLNGVSKNIVAESHLPP